MTRDKTDSDKLPDSLIAELKESDRATPVITAKVDRAVLTSARKQFASRPEKRRKVAPAWFAVAATVLLAILVLPNNENSAPIVTQLYTDVDQSGQIDIADVLALARDGSQNITKAELDAFAIQVVSLSNGGDSS